MFKSWYCFDHNKKTKEFTEIHHSWEGFHDLAFRIGPAAAIGRLLYDIDRVFFIVPKSCVKNWKSLHDENIPVTWIFNLN